MDSIKTTLKLSLLVFCTIFAFGCTQHAGGGCCSGAHDMMKTCSESKCPEHACGNKECSEHHCAKCGGHHGEAYHNSEQMKTPGTCHKSM